MTEGDAGGGAPTARSCYPSPGLSPVVPQMIMKLTALAGALGALLLTGCSVSEVRKEVNTRHAGLEHQAKDRLNQMATSGPTYRTIRMSETPWLGVREFKNEVTGRAALPPVFHKNITLIFPDRVNLSTIAERITEVTSVPVILRPDVFIRASTLLPQSAANAQPLQGGSPPPQDNGSQGVGGLSSAQASSDYELTANLNFTGTLAGLLDMLAAKTGTSWKYENGSIVWYRLVTKTFVLQSTPGSSEMTASIGKSASAQVGATGEGAGGSSGSFSGDASVRMESSFSVWKNMKESIEAMLSPVGRVAVTEATGTVTVTDVQHVIDEVESMMREVNKALTRQVAIRVEVLSVSNFKGGELSLDLQGAFNRYLRDGAFNYGINLSTPTPLTGNVAGGLAYSVLTPPGEQGTRSGLSGSQIALQALAEAGKVNVVHTASTVTLNRQPVPVAITDQVAYVRALSREQTGEGDSANTLVEIEPGVVTTGFILNLLPFITDEDSVLMQFSIDVSTLKRMGVFGEGVSAIQTPEVASMQFLQRVGLRNGQTLVLSGFERNSSMSNARSLDEKISPLVGGSQAANTNKESIVILITPVISEGL